MEASAGNSGELGEREGLRSRVCVWEMAGGGRSPESPFVAISAWSQELLPLVPARGAGRGLQARGWRWRGCGDTFRHDPTGLRFGDPVCSAHQLIHWESGHSHSASLGLSFPLCSRRGWARRPLNTGQPQCRSSSTRYSDSYRVCFRGRAWTPAGVHAAGRAGPGFATEIRKTDRRGATASRSSASELCCVPVTLPHGDLEAPGVRCSPRITSSPGNKERGQTAGPHTCQAPRPHPCSCADPLGGSRHVSFWETGSGSKYPGGVAGKGPCPASHRAVTLCAPVCDFRLQDDLPRVPRFGHTCVSRACAPRECRGHMEHDSLKRASPRRAHLGPVSEHPTLPPSPQLPVPGSRLCLYEDGTEVTGGYFWSVPDNSELVLLTKGQTWEGCKCRGPAGAEGRGRADIPPGRVFPCGASPRKEAQ